MYKKAKVHKGKQAKCKVCMAKIAAVDPEFAARVSKLAQLEDKKKGKR
jgi:hypothetical protein